MQHKLSSQCSDRNLFNLNEHLDSANLASDCCAPLDDVEIATGQASFDDGDVHDELRTWFDLNRSRPLGEDSDDVLADFDYNPSQAHSAPAKGWDTGRFERSDSAATLQYRGSSSVKEREPWSHLQTFALSAPEHDDQSSRGIQIDAISQWPSSLQDNDPLRPSIIDFCHQRQNPTKHRRMPQNPYSVEGSFTQHSRLHDQARSARSPHLPDSGRFEHRLSQTTGQQMTSSSTSSSFSQPATSRLHLETNSAQFFDPRSAYPFHHPSFDEAKGVNRMRQDPEIDFAHDRGLIEESGYNALPASQDVLTPQELSWQQQDPFLFGHQFGTSTDTEYGSYGLGLTAHDHAWPPDFVRDSALEFATLDHPGAIKIGASSGHYKPDLTSSYPPSAGCYPDYLPAMQGPGRHRPVISTSEPNILPSSPPNLPFRKNSSKPTPNRGSRSGSLSIIREYGHSPHGSPILSRNGSGKGKRKGPLPTATAIAAAQKRKDGNVCIRCRTMKMTCKGGLPCEGCRQITKVKLWDQSCTPANFSDMVKEDACNAIFQHAISHPVLDGSRRLVVAVPTPFHVSRLLDRLESCQLRYDIRVRHSSGSSYTLDLSKCFKTLAKVHKSSVLETCELQDFVKNKQSRSAWLQCVREYDSSASVVDRSIQWNNMPSRNSYEISPHNLSVPGRALDVEDQQDQRTIIFAAQLTRVILRALEIEAFDALQKSVNELTKGGKSDADIQILIDQLGRIVVSLRWRVSWWAVVGDSPDERFTSRVTKLTQILYCYYFVARKKMSPWSVQLPSRICSVYADVEPVHEDLPLTDSLDGFHAWMQKGQAVVQAAKFQRNVTRSLPTAHTNPHP